MKSKKELRQEALARRQNFSPEAIDKASEAIAKLFFGQISLSTVRFLHTFLPISQNKEIDTWKIIQGLRQHFPQIKLVAPVSHFHTHTLTHHLFTLSTPLTTNTYGIPEPTSGELITPQELDLILVPLLGFDLHGHRLGYGGGFYDRFLAECRPEALKIGLSLEGPIEFPAEAHDIPLHAVISPEKVILFS